LVYAARRPLPTQSGDGSYLETKTPNSLLQDLKAVGLKGISIIMDMMKSKVSGKLVDDKTYLMERVIQV
jgi:linoleate 10R-lipoxygenase